MSLSAKRIVRALRSRIVHDDEHNRRGVMMDGERSSHDQRHASEASAIPKPPFSRRRFLQYAAAVSGTAAAVTTGLEVAGPAQQARAAAIASRKHLTQSINDLKHVVILMQENRSFDHYFGTLRGVRGFGDKQMLTYQNGTTIFQQPDPARKDLGYLLPYNLTDQTDGDLDHGWDGDHEAWNGGLWNNWVPAKTEETMGYFTRKQK